MFALVNQAGLMKRAESDALASSDGSAEELTTQEKNSDADTDNLLNCL